ncbi:plasmid partitioning protein RepB [Paracoccus alkanivorans]|uniref:Plasmid partitioning protein RepB n=1 Tax=Paracoccus alkanivorans TaxID=2116655 RepID=A0A3M0LZ77_9RHOB|nr:plasmid partitioning protein RepB [Paracoccus alkanivorans]RMC30792.1 plasmid partitioning protein RepB [Paracoccus alkanivorans]
MARKDLLKGLMTEGASAAREDSPAPPRYSRGAIGAVSRSIADLKSRALIEVPADMIDDAGIKDRLDDDPEGIEALKQSMAEYGQQVPVLLRHSPNYEGRYEVVFGRRRVRALRELQMPVKAMLRQLNDRELIVAQGQENTARKDLSFIEKANFAAQMTRVGYERKVICDALSIDKTVISRMLSVTDAIPEEVIRAIGAAPGAGRDRWLALAEKAKGRDADALIEAAKGPDSDARFVAVLASLAAPRPARIAPRDLQGQDGVSLGTARKTKGKTVIELSGEGRAFADWLVDRIEELHRDWQKKEGRAGR